MEKKESDIKWYFVVKIIIISLLCAGYVISNYKNDMFSVFGTTTFLYFIPFILDYALKEKGVEIYGWVKNIALTIPIVTSILYLVSQMILADNENFATMTVSFPIELIFSILSFYYVICAYLDYNKYTKNNESAKNDRAQIKTGVDNRFKENLSDQVRQVEKGRQEGLKKVATESQKRKKKKGHGRQ